jgi:hypothetical protein
MLLPTNYIRIGHHPFLENRGFTTEDYHTYECGIVPKHIRLDSRIIFPIKEVSSKICGYLARTIGAEMPRYYYQKGADYDLLLYGLEKFKSQKSVYLCEGLFDKHKIDKFACLGEDDICLAAFSHRLTDTQAHKLLAGGVKNLYLWYDFDLYHKTIDIALKWHHYFNIFIPKYQDTNLDPGDMNSEEILLVKNSFTSFYPETSLYVNLKFS